MRRTRWARACRRSWSQRTGFFAPPALPALGCETSRLTGFSPLQHEADALGAGLPPLMVAADRLAASVSLGVHGRKRAGIGETFWQFRRYYNEDATRIDWRQSAKSQQLFVREREWEAAQTVLFWSDAGPDMNFASGSV